MSFSVIALYNTCNPPQTKEGRQADKNNEVGSLIMDVVLATLVLGTGIMAMTAGAGHHLGPFNFLGNLSQAWSISLISAGGGVILFELSLFAIKSCKEEPLVKTNRPKLPLPEKAVVKPTESPTTRIELKDELVITTLEETDSTLLPTPPRNPDGSPKILNDIPPTEVGGSGTQPLSPSSDLSVSDLTGVSSPEKKDPDLSSSDLNFLFSGFGDSSATGNSGNVLDLLHGSFVQHGNPSEIEASPFLPPPPPSSITAGHSSALSESFLGALVLPPPPALSEHNLDELNTSFVDYVKKQPPRPAPDPSKPADMTVSLNRTHDRVIVDDALFYVREYFELKLNAPQIQPSNDLEASVLVAASTEIETEALPGWFKDYLVSLRGFMYEGKTVEERTERLGAISIALDKLEKDIKAATKIANPVVDPEVARKEMEAQQAAEKVAALEKQKVILKEAQYHSFYGDTFHDLTTLDPKNIQEYRAQRIEQEMGEKIYEPGLENLEKLKTHLGKVNQNELIQPEDLNVIIESGKIVKDFAIKFRNLCLAHFVSKAKLFDSACPTQIKKIDMQ